MDQNAQNGLAGHEIRALQREFTDRGWRFEQVYRLGMVAIYRKTKVSAAGTTLESWEVVKIRVGKAHPRDSDQRRIERYPRNKEWGTYAWTCLTYERAKERAYAMA